MFKRDIIDNNNLVFIKSKNIKAFPCGRRRSSLVDTDNNNDTVSDRYYIPFDPEARINTEANNRKHSGLNGFKQSYLNYWKLDGSISLVLGGYLFDITAEYGYATGNLFGTAVAESLNISNGSLFVNIKLATMEFFAGSDNIPAANTEILRDQTTSKTPLECLDQPIADGVDTTKLDNYYFCGLSLSNVNLEEAYEGAGWISLQLLDFIDGVWVIHEASRLPKIDHGDERDSVKIPGSLIIENNLIVNGEISADAVKIKDGDGQDAYATTLKVVTNQNVTNQLQFWTKPKSKV